jgi:hypothetical protein
MQLHRRLIFFNFSRQRMPRLKIAMQLFLLLFRFHFDTPIFYKVEIHNGLCRRELLYKIDFDLCVDWYRACPGRTN